MTTNKNEPEYMQKIWEDVEQELVEKREMSDYEAHLFHRHRIAENIGQGYNVSIVTQNLTFLYEGLIEWTFLMDEPALSSLFLTTIPLACYVRINEQTRKYESAMYLLAYEDDRIAIMADTKNSLIMAYSLDQDVFYLNLPFADAVQNTTRKLYEGAIDVRDLKSVTGPSGESLKVLFER